ncbi:unnamed protein product [Chrysodeixis includens]|uniref:Uncharacterized protein n=1 Tax=Chrysodeixis includens TaxID=689277 RepID=A0A9P0C0C8_CHRIL|nr:unnamed protein product [Chrysodeixis includens]
MRLELPDIKRCICCVPLRYGLVFWGYVRLFETIMSIYKNAVTIHTATEDEHTGFSFIASCIIVALEPIDLVIVILFIIGCHKKNMLLLKIYMYYNIGELIIQCLLLLAITGFFMYLYYVLHKYGAAAFHPHSISWSLLSSVATLTGIILLQGYVLLLVRSEIKKLNSNCQFRFVNNAADSNCVIQLEEGAENDVEKTKEGQEETKNGEEEVKSVTNDLYGRSGYMLGDVRN